MKIVFMGTPEFSVPVLNALIKDHQIVAVYTQPPRPAGRGQTARPSPVHARALTLGLTVRHPVTLKTAELQTEFTALGADIAVVVAYGLILPQQILDAPRMGCVNIHASLLPRWRGAAPIHRAIMAGDNETGICIMQMEAGLDTGPVLLRETTAIGATETTADLHDRLSVMGARMVCDVLRSLPTHAKPQPDQGVSYATKISKAEARIDWTQTATQVDRNIRGMSPFPGAWCNAAGERVKFLRSQLAVGHGKPGQRLGGLIIACGTGAIEVTLAQREGKRPMLAQDFLNGAALPDMLT